jgi:hypothetical protein
VNGKRARRDLVDHLVDVLPFVLAVIGLILFLAFWG